MSSELEAILESKRKLRRKLAAMPIGDKLRMLDALRERHMEIKRAAEKAGLRPPAK
jgi:hypothetical protein